MIRFNICFLNPKTTVNIDGVVEESGYQARIPSTYSDAGAGAGVSFGSVGAC